jgi:hypothetical protein
MHPIVAQELMKAIQRDLEERVGSTRRRQAATRRRWFRRDR